MTSWNEIRRAASSSEAIWRPLPLSASSSASPCFSDLRVKESRDEIAAAAQAVLDARALYPAASLAELYDPLVMPPELRRFGILRGVREGVAAERQFFAARAGADARNPKGLFNLASKAKRRSILPK